MIRFLKYLSLYLLFLGVGYALVPGQTEKVAVQIKERKYFEAREDLLRTFDRTNSSPEELLQLAEIAEQLGFVEEMHQMHEAYVQQSPDDLWVLRKIELYHRLSGDFRGYVESLKAIARLSTEPEDRDKLLSTLRFEGLYEEELAELSQFEAKGLLKPEQLGRLGMLHFQAERMEEAARALAQLHQSTPLTPKYWPARLAYFHSLLEIGDFLQAESVAVSLRETNEPWADYDFRSEFLRYGRDEYMREVEIPEGVANILSCVLKPKEGSADCP
ncbi:M48 family metallopeptidase [Pseudovibrio sp. JE062]|uniref:tetratricopeptide repeat protein n=1 Tax=Pseudovibrio sp. JE062 TaxID=439495 RepID=UPI000186C615|nr:hypothetical protein [Pseudovibrio sp. JE062]EEA96087.1 tetratricopeptide repeat domain protein [Pseudovibrio sp. JE062]